MTLLLRSGDLVQIKTPSEIYHLLENSGTLLCLPFMPEMAKFCGMRFRVSDRVVQATMDALAVPNYSGSYVREFKSNDVIFLEGVRCSGVFHGGCQRGCRIFWKEAWLEKINGGVSANSQTAEDIEHFSLKLKTVEGSGRYICQSSEFEKATNNLSALKRIKKCFDAVIVGNCSMFDMLKRLSIWGYLNARQRFMGPFPRGNRKPTPIGVLNLQAGEMVEVKTLKEIIQTLDSKGCNRGLHFSVDMVPYCGKKLKVRSRADKLIAEMTGEMRGIPNTVILEGPTHDGPTYAFGGCPRLEYPYWREIWLKRL
jgi:hypothetical protein